MLADVNDGGYLSYRRNSRRCKYCPSLVSISPLALQCRPVSGSPSALHLASRDETMQTGASTRPTKEKSMGDRIRRSWLIVPAHDEARMEEAAHAGADVIGVDLQDMVHDTKKQEARARIRETI